MHRKGWIIKLILINKFYFIFIMNYIIVISIIICFLLVIITFLRRYFKEKFTLDTCLSRDTSPQWKCVLDTDLCTIRMGENDEKKCQHMYDDKACDFYDNNESECNTLDPNNSKCIFVTESDGSTKCKDKQPDSYKFTSDCYTKDQTACESDSKCSYKELTIDGSQVGKCVHKLSCGDGEILVSSVDSSGNKIVSCEKCAKGEYLDSNTSKCVSCEYGKYTDSEGATSCQDKTVCNLATQYIDLDIDEDIPSSLSDYEWKIKLQSKFYKDEFGVSENRECQELSSCLKDEYVDNHLNYIHPNYEGEAQDEFETRDAQSEGDATHCKIKTSPETCNTDSRCEWNADLFKCYPKGHQNKRFSNYSCNNLSVCNENQFISNYQNVTANESKFSGMLTSDFECQNSSNCIPGEHEVTNRVTDEFPIVTNRTGAEMYSQDRDCTTCPVHHYSDEPNITVCALQPTAGIGYGAVDYDKNTFASKTKQVQFEKCEAPSFYQDEAAPHRSGCKPQVKSCNLDLNETYKFYDYETAGRSDVICNAVDNPDFLSHCKIEDCLSIKDRDAEKLVGN
jgi:hypothetical protein